MEQQGLSITRETLVRPQRDFLAAEVIRKVIGQTFSFSRPLRTVSSREALRQGPS